MSEQEVVASSNTFGSSYSWNSVASSKDNDDAHVHVDGADHQHRGHQNSRPPLEMGPALDLPSPLLGLNLPPGTPEGFSILTVPRSPHFTLRHVTRVSKRAAIATKNKIWDSNDASIVAAQSAVDQWEQGYNALRGLLVASVHSAKGLYGAAKTGVYGLEHGLLQPVRDWILLPAFGGVEKIASETVGFLQSEQASLVAHHGLGLIKNVPYVGENILAPAVCIGADVLRKTWQIAQYPIPSPNQVRDSVDFVMTGTKWALSTAGREVYWYIKRADANITRTLSHTRWKVLGSGPYATLDKLNKLEVIDHLCERYFSLSDTVARYELAAHIRAHNRPLYNDLVLTGLLRHRGGELTTNDEWLASCPSYRSLGEQPFLLYGVLEHEIVFFAEREETNDSIGGISADHASGKGSIDGGVANHGGNDAVFPLYFRLPYENGKRPPRDAPWVRFNGHERKKLEAHYCSILKKFAAAEDLPPPRYAGENGYREGATSQEPQYGRSDYPTIAHWYNPDLNNDLLVDEKRHTVNFSPCCPKCRRRHHDTTQPPMVTKAYGELCSTCSCLGDLEAPWVDALLTPPPLTMTMKPNVRFFVSFIHMSCFQVLTHVVIFMIDTCRCGDLMDQATKCGVPFGS
jgi:hypothetical protein